MGWNPKAFEAIVNQTVKEGIFQGKSVTCKRDIYKVLKEKLCRQDTTFDKWEKDRGPGSDLEMIRKLEELFGVREGAFETDKKQEDEEMKKSMVLSDVNKTAIFNTYCFMKDYLHNDELESEECLAYMWHQVEKQKILIPPSLYNKIDEFIKKWLAPIVYENSVVYADCYTEDLGFFDEEGVFVTHDEDAAKILMKNYLLKTISIEQELDMFAEKELQPFLI